MSDQINPLKITTPKPHKPLSQVKWQILLSEISVCQRNIVALKRSEMREGFHLPTGYHRERYKILNMVFNVFIYSFLSVSLLFEFGSFM